MLRPYIVSDGTMAAGRILATPPDLGVVKARPVTPSFTLVLDILHALTYLWPATKALHAGWIADGGRHRHRRARPLGSGGGHGDQDAQPTGLA